MQTAVQLTFSFEIASLQLTPTFKMRALQLKPTSKIVTMRLAPSQQPQPAMNLQVTFEISNVQAAGGGIGQMELLCQAHLAVCDRHQDIAVAVDDDCAVVDRAGMVCHLADAPPVCIAASARASAWLEL